MNWGNGSILGRGQHRSVEERIALFGHLRRERHEIAIRNVHLTHLPDKDRVRWL